MEAVEQPLAETVRRAAAEARRLVAAAEPGPGVADRLPFAMLARFDAEIRGALERDPRIEDERDRVLVLAVRLGEAPAEEAGTVEAARAGVIDAVDYLEQAVLRFGIVSRQGARAGGGTAGSPVAKRA